MQSKIDLSDTIRILLVEDDDAYAMLIGRMLKRAKIGKFSVERVDSQQSAFERLPKGDIDLVLLDLHLPDTNGLATLDSFINKEYDVPIVILTSLNDEITGIKALQKGAQDYIIKSDINEELLIRSIRYSIERYNLISELKRNTKALEASEERFRIITEQNADAIVVVDDERIVRFVNPTAEKVFNRSADEFIGKQFDFSSEYGVETDIEVSSDGENSTILECRANRIKWQDRDAILMTLRDVTERKQVEKMKDEVISIVSHEIRGPLTSIINSLSLIIDGETGDIPEPTKKMIEIAYRNSERLLRLTNDMLDIRKIESGKMEFNYQVLEVMPLIEQAIEANRSYADQFKVRIRLENTIPDAKIKTDSDRFIQILTNLLTNAAKFSPPEDEIIVSVSRNKGFLRISVKDHGPGIPEEFQNRIFSKFAQFTAQGARRKGGSGLGLSISKMLVENLGGSIGFETKPNEGTTFYFDLPEYQE
ncbi:TPA: response regulator [Candidatus Poribacteria bacterium]|nr:response regulator [Candidatus Poribacteria bacterium]